MGTGRKEILMRRAIVLLVVAPLALTACGSSGGSKSSGPKLSPAAYVTQAAKKSSTAPSEHVKMQAVTSVQGQEVDISGSGDFDNTSHQGSMTAHATLGGIDLQIDEILDGTTIYMKSPLFAATLPAGKTWVKLDLQKFGKTKGIDFSALMSQDPNQSFAQLQASGQVTEVGEETLYGVSVIHYRGHIDVSKLPQGAQIEAFTKAKYGPYNVWIGKDDGYVHQIALTYSYVAPNVGRQKATITTTFSDFGKTVTVNVPSDADVVDATPQTIKGLGG
jgi:LppX_LprAFG lipoprotein